MGSLSYLRTVVDRNVVVRRIPVVAFRIFANAPVNVTKNLCK